MGVKVAATCLHLSQTLLPHPPPSSHCYSYQSLASSSPSSSSPSLSSPPISSVGSGRRRRRRSLGGLEGTLACHVFHLGDRTTFLGGGGGGLFRSRSCDMVSGLDAEQGTTLRRVVSASLTDSFFSDGDDEDEEDFARRLQDLAFRCQEDAAAQADAFFAENSRNQGEGEPGTDDFRLRDYDDSFSVAGGGISTSQFHPSYSANGQPSPTASATPPPWLGVRPEPPDWVEEGRREIVPAAGSVERNAASVDLPLSLRILKRKKRWESESWIREASETAACSVKKALSSLILGRVHREVHASFCWLFGHIFASTPTLMVSVMLLLANFTVYSMGHGVAVAAPSMGPSLLPQPCPAMTATFVASDEIQQKPAPPSWYGAAPSTAVSFSSGWKTVGKVGAVAGASDDGRWGEGLSSLHQRRTILPDGISSLPSTTRTGDPSDSEGADKGTAVVPVEEEERVWSRIVEEAAQMQAANRDEALMDQETLQRLVSPVVVEAVPDEDYPDYLRTELMYQQAVSQDPTNAMLLCNFAQFLYLVSRDHDRAEYYFKRAAEMQPPDAEALGRYASFLWLAKNDLGAAEETYLEAIAADPGNTAHAANYAHFLWNTGGEDTCYPLSGLDEEEGAEEEEA
ncbi:unnamed protein product [Spirodela intermedia]|uniref:Uncharacterized protein n=1 Tax=Spirodela intermedia TaxID=51605 RepID=A0A7I8IBI2_SPIIN|nr:unnamed protein product [Spirodela intermedia]CAA6655127.1 unnamed protein product [Spirodela intermedia]